MNTDKITYLIEAVESGTFTRAAEKLNLTQSGLNRQISSLESELKTTLIVRSRKGIRLARGADKIYERLKTIRKLEKLLDEEISEFHGALCGELAIGAYYSVAASWLPEVLKEFCKRYPKIKIKIVEGVNKTFLEQMDSGKLDCAFVANPSKGFDWYPIVETEYVAWLPPGHPLENKVALRPEDLKNEAMIYPKAHENTDIDYFFETHRLKPVVKFETQGPASTFAMVSAGLGVSINNRLQSESLKGNALIRSFSPKEKFYLGIMLPPIESASPATLAFLTLAQKHKKSLTY